MATGPVGTAELEAEYVIPLRWPAGHDPALTTEMAEYLSRLRRWVDVTVVDGSEPETAFLHRRAWSAWCRVVPPLPWPGCNGKVAGVVTGVHLSRHERVVLGDDDVRFDREALRAVLQALEGADLVRPQNVFAPAPWHARWDTGRILLNRALGTDHGGACALRRSTFVRMGGYDGDVLFENLQLARTVLATGGRVVDLPGTYVRRLPPTFRHFAGQRVRQAYDDLAQPTRLATELCLLPALVTVLARRPSAAVPLGVLVVALAERGRRRAGGTRVWPPTASAWALPWLLERAVCVWLALGARARGGVRYGDRRVLHASTPPRPPAEPEPGCQPTGHRHLGPNPRPGRGRPRALSHEVSTDGEATLTARPRAGWEPWTS